MSENEPKDKIISLLLCFFLGTLGAHKFYEGNTNKGILYLVLGVPVGFVTFGITTLVVCVLCIIDFIKLLSVPDKYNPC